MPAHEPETFVEERVVQPQRIVRATPPPIETPSPVATAGRTPAPAPSPAPESPAARIATPEGQPAPPPADVARMTLPSPPPPLVRPVRDDELLVRQALQQYRRAYDGLDAQSARAVWPAVDEAALARAFDGLESQQLAFDACDVRMQGEQASATCRGSARYVAKYGAREPRVEPRVWQFTLRKLAGEWKIESARADR
jgi:hypothetical protein